MNFRSLIIIIISSLVLLSPCSIKAYIHHIFEIEQTYQTSKNQVKTIQKKTINCSISKFETVKKTIKNLDVPNFDLPDLSIHFFGLARSSLIEEDIDSNEIQSPKIPFYLLYKQLKYSL